MRFQIEISSHQVSLLTKAGEKIILQENTSHHHNAIIVKFVRKDDAWIVSHGVGINFSHEVTLRKRGIYTICDDSFNWAGVSDHEFCPILYALKIPNSTLNRCDVVPRNSQGIQLHSATGHGSSEIGFTVQGESGKFDEIFVTNTTSFETFARLIWSHRLSSHNGSDDKAGLRFLDALSAPIDKGLMLARDWVKAELTVSLCIISGEVNTRRLLVRPNNSSSEELSACSFEPQKPTRKGLGSALHFLIEKYGLRNLLEGLIKIEEETPKSSPKDLETDADKNAFDLACKVHRAFRDANVARACILDHFEIFVYRQQFESEPQLTWVKRETNPPMLEDSLVALLKTHPGLSSILAASVSEANTQYGPRVLLPYSSLVKRDGFLEASRGDQHTRPLWPENETVQISMMDLIGKATRISGTELAEISDLPPLGLLEMPEHGEGIVLGPALLLRVPKGRTRKYVVPVNVWVTEQKSAKPTMWAFQVSRKDDDKMEISGWNPPIPMEIFDDIKPRVTFVRGS